MEKKRIEYFNIKKESFVFNHIRISETNPDDYFIHTHDVPELFYIVEVSGCHIIEDKEYRLSGGDLIIVPPATYHSIKLSPGSTYERYNICFEPEILGDIDVDKIYKNISVINCAGHSRLPDIFKKTDFYAKCLSQNDFSDMVKLVIKEIFCNLSVYDGTFDIEPKYLSPILSKAIEYINKNLYSIESVSEVSESLYIAESYLFKIFRTQLKTSPKKYILSKRLHSAKKEIILGAKPTEVFSKIGFNDYASFYRSYLNFFGHSPSQEKYFGFTNEKF